MLKIVTGRINSGKTTYIRGVIKNKLDSVADKVYLIVPEQFSFESERSMLTLLGEKEALKVEVCSFSRLAQNILGDIHGVRMLDEAGFPDCDIYASNSLDEILIKDMLNQGAKIDGFIVGEKLITSSTSPVLDGVYKLCETEKNGEKSPAIMLSNNENKITTRVEIV